MKAERNLIKLLIDRAKDKHGIPSDAQLAGALGVTPQTLSQWKSRQIPITDERVIDLAKIAGDPPDLWLVMMQFDQAKTPAAKKSWEAAAVRLASAIDGLKLTAIAGLCAIGFALPLLGKAHQIDVSGTSANSEVPHTAYYVRDELDCPRQSWRRILPGRFLCRGLSQAPLTPIRHQVLSVRNHRNGCRAPDSSRGSAPVSSLGRVAWPFRWLRVRRG